MILSSSKIDVSDAYSTLGKRLAADATMPVSVVLPVFNGDAVIQACIDSLLLQDFPADQREIIVVDNGSTDGTAAMLAAYGARVRVITESRRGVSNARNAGIRAARHELIAFIDADCTAESGWLRAITAPLVADQSVSGVGGRIRALDGANHIARFGEQIHDHRKAIEVYTPPYLISMNAALRRSVLVDLGGFDPEFVRAQDADLSFRLHGRSHRIAYAPEAVIRHHNESTLRGLFAEGFTHGQWQVLLFKRHRDGLLKHHKAVHTAEYRRLFTMALDIVTTGCFRKSRRARTKRYRLVFDLGKKCGHVIGSIRFGTVRL